MARALNVNPNRMELSRLKRLLVVAKRGHKLLKDKQDALVKEFLEKSKKTYQLRKEVEQELSNCYGGFMTARAMTLPKILEQTLLTSSGEMAVDVSYKNVMSVNIPSFSCETLKPQLNYGLAGSPGSLDVALEKFLTLLPKLLKLAAEEKAIFLMGQEIERTRRRVNALEHVMIPSYTDSIKMISMKLDEMERATLSRLMVIKEIVRNH